MFSQRSLCERVIADEKGKFPKGKSLPTALLRATTAPDKAILTPNHPPKSISRYEKVAYGYPPSENCLHICGTSHEAKTPPGVFLPLEIPSKLPFDAKL